MIDDELHLLLGAYVLGGLSGEDRRLFEQHLPGCARCRAELSEVAGLPGLLRRADSVPMSVDDVASGGDVGLTAVLARARHDRLGNRRTRIAVSLVAACAVGGAAAVGITQLHHDDTPAGRTAALTSGPENQAHGNVILTKKVWGTSIRISLSGMPHSGTFTLEAIDDGGQAEPAATWAGTETGSMNVGGATSIDITHLRSLRVLGPDDELMASAEV